MPSLLDFWLTVGVAVCSGVLAAVIVFERTFR